MRRKLDGKEAADCQIQFLENEATQRSAVSTRMGSRGSQKVANSSRSVGDGHKDCSEESFEGFLVCSVTGKIAAAVTSKHGTWGKLTTASADTTAVVMGYRGKPGLWA